MAVKKVRNERVYNKLSKLRQMDGMSLRWGFFEDADPYPEDGSRYKEDIPVAQVAKWIEEGHPNGGIFAGTYTEGRPFFQSHLDNVKRPLRAMIRRYYKMMMKGAITPRERLETIGENLVHDLQGEIERYTTPENQPGTVDKKGFNKPLYETGRLLDSVDFKIVDKE